MPVRLCPNMSFIRALPESGFAPPAAVTSGREATEKEWLGSWGNGVFSANSLSIVGEPYFEFPRH